MHVTTAPPRLLIVDDDPLVRDVCLRFFHAARVDVAGAASGEEAIRLLDAQPFDCVLSDYRLGGATGIDVLTHAWRTRPAAARVLMSGFLDPAIVAGARARALVHDVFEKPWSVTGFDAVLREIVLDRHLLGARASPGA